MFGSWSRYGALRSLEVSDITLGMLWYARETIGRRRGWYTTTKRSKGFDGRWCPELAVGIPGSLASLEVLHANGRL